VSPRPAKATSDLVFRSLDTGSPNKGVSQSRQRSQGAAFKNAGSGRFQAR